MAARNQNPSYNLFTGDSPPRKPLHESTLRQSILVKAGSHVKTACYLDMGLTLVTDISNENLRAQRNALQYELDSLKQERELKVLQHQGEIRDVERRAEADFKRAQVNHDQKSCVGGSLTRTTERRDRAQCCNQEIRGRPA